MDSHRDLFTRRWRKVRKVEPSEYQIQIALIQQLKLLGRPDMTYFHCPSGGKRSPREAALFKALGVVPGVSDLIFFWPIKNALFLELKTGKHFMTPEQLVFQERMRAVGFFTEWTNTLDDAIAILRRYELLGRKVSGDGPMRISRAPPGV
jgi:hypothetical protein